MKCYILPHTCNINGLLVIRFLTECDDFHFGFNCKQKCVCRNGKCDSISGKNIFYSVVNFIYFC